MSATLRIPDAEVSVFTDHGRKYVDVADLELWLRLTADYLRKQTASGVPAAVVAGLADCVRGMA